LNVIPLVLTHKSSIGHCPHFLSLHSFEPTVHIDSSSFQGAIPKVLAARALNQTSQRLILSTTNKLFTQQLQHTSVDCESGNLARALLEWMRMPIKK
jgi:hypothetical protein